MSKNNEIEQDNDVAIMLKAKNGNSDAFTLLQQKYEKEIHILFYKHHNHNPHNGQEPEDFAQEVFFRLWENREGYQPKAEFRTYLYTIANNLSINLWNKNKRTPKLVSPNDENNPIDIVDKKSLNPSEALIQKEQNLQLKKAIDSLPEEQRKAFTLKEYEGLSYKEIARILDCPVKTVSSRKARAVRKLKKLLLSLKVSNNR